MPKRVSKCTTIGLACLSIFSRLVRGETVLEHMLLNGGKVLCNGKSPNTYGWEFRNDLLPTDDELRGTTIQIKSKDPIKDWSLTNGFFVQAKNFGTDTPWLGISFSQNPQQSNIGAVDAFRTFLAEVFKDSALKKIKGNIQFRREESDKKNSLKSFGFEIVNTSMLQGFDILQMITEVIERKISSANNELANPLAKAICDSRKVAEQVRSAMGISFRRDASR